MGQRPNPRHGDPPSASICSTCLSRFLLPVVWTALFAAPDLTAAEDLPPAERSRKNARPWARLPVLGLGVERAEDGVTYRLVESGSDAESNTLFVGRLDECDIKLVSELERRHGTGRTNWPLWTAGGRQFWADEFVSCGWRIQRHVGTGHHRLLDPGNVRRAWGDYAGCRVVYEKERVARRLTPRSRRLVVLAHGLLRSRASFRPLREELALSGFEVIDFGYPSTRASIEEHAAQLGRVLDRTSGVDSVSFVTHSLGGLVVRHLLARPDSWRERLKVDRFVMIAPPNRGSRLAERLEHSFLFNLVTGRAGGQLTRAAVAKIPLPSCSFGVIAGSGGLNPLLPGDDDWVVTVDTTRLAGSDDFLQVRHGHTKILQRRAVIRATLSFLRFGRFLP